jgi:hypothetical protein
MGYRAGGLGGLLALASVAAPSPAAAQSIATLWKGRGVEALERLQVLEKAADANVCEIMLEFAFAMIAEGTSQKRLENGGNAFHLVLKSDKDQLFDLIYAYDAQGGLIGVRVDHMPAGWTVFYPEGGPARALMVDTAEGCSWWFDIDNPFRSVATGPSRRISQTSAAPPTPAELDHELRARWFMQCCSGGVGAAIDALPSVSNRDEYHSRGLDSCRGSLSRLRESGQLQKEDDLTAFACGYAVGAMFSMYGLDGEIQPRMSERAMRAGEACRKKMRAQWATTKGAAGRMP